MVDLRKQGAGHDGVKECDGGQMGEEEGRMGCLRKEEGRHFNLLGHFIYAVSSLKHSY